MIDRTNGQFISGDPFVYTSWAKSIDSTTGRPIETDFARFDKSNTDISPTYDGAHNWHPMAYNPNTNLVYIPAAERVAPYGHDPHWEHGKSGFGSGNGWNLGTGTDPTKPFRKDTIAARLAPKGMLIAWDPVTRQEKWRITHPADWNGGVLATASDIVWQGTADGRFVAYDAAIGTKIWETNVGGGVIAPPVTYMVDGRQYITLLVGWGSGVGQKENAHLCNPVAYSLLHSRVMPPFLCIIKLTFKRFPIYHLLLRKKISSMARFYLINIVLFAM
ncbi:MAG: PQQ-binding-like beta-propeller repeat protein [Saprospiraceae bacterium]|nr:PQQ-binding-like beta-propeller repeat protein [Saprospiraceae bacterium]